MNRMKCAALGAVLACVAPWAAAQTDSRTNEQSTAAESCSGMSGSDLQNCLRQMQLPGATDRGGEGQMNDQRSLSPASPGTDNGAPVIIIVTPDSAQ